MKQKLLIITVVFVIMLFSFAYISRRSKEKSESTQNKVEQVSWKNIKAGETTIDDLGKIGEPIETKKTDQGEVLYYPTLNQYLQNEVEVQDNKVAFIKEVLYASEDRSLKNKMDALDSSYQVLYGPDSNSGILLIAYPEKGVAYLANQQGDFTFEAWYFPPTTLDGLLSLPQLSGYSIEEMQRLD